MNNAVAQISVRVNGINYTREVEHRLTLGDFLRHHLGLTGTHLGCEHGVCGACTVLIDGVSMRSCLMLAVQACRHEVTTVEALAAADGHLKSAADGILGSTWSPMRILHARNFDELDGVLARHAAT